MTIELIDDKNCWDTFVEGSPQGLLFHRWDFLKTVERNSRWRFLPYGIYLDDELKCIFPFFIGRERGLTVMCSPPPNMAQIWYLGPAFYPEVLEMKAHSREIFLEKVTSEICDEIDRIGPNYVKFTTVPDFLDVRFFIWKNYTTQLMFTYAVNLERPVEEIFASFSTQCRKNIKKVSKHAPEIQQSHDVGITLDSWRKGFSERGQPAPILSDGYLKELADAFPREITVYNLILDGDLATSTVGCIMNKGRYCTWIGGVNAHKDLPVVEYINWEIIQRSKAEGFKMLDLGGGVKNLSRFKSHFSPLLQPYCVVERKDALSEMGDFTIKKIIQAKKFASATVSRFHH